MDCDDTHIGSALHPGAPVISAALAQAELKSNCGRVISGRTFYEALAIGYEIMCRLGNSLSGTLHHVGFHPTGILVIFGAAAAAGKLAGFDPLQMEMLFGIVGSMASGPMKYLENGAWNKRLHLELSAHNAILGIQSVKSGIVGPTKVIEGEFGILKSYGRRGIDMRITESPGSAWEFINTAIKPYASCRLTHATIDAVYQLRMGCTVVRDVRVDVQFSKKSYLLVGNPAPNKIHPENIIDAQFSIYYHLAVAWLYGHNDWTCYEYLGNEDVRILSRQITVSVDDSLTDESLLTRVKIGERVVTVKYPLGEPQNPISTFDVEKKFHEMAAKVYDVPKQRISVH